MNKNNKQTGLTMIELLVAVAIIGLLATMAFPLLLHSIHDARLQSASENAYSFLSLAKSLPIKRNANLYLTINSGSNWCLGLSETSGCDCLSDTCKVNGVQYRLNAAEYTGVSLATANLSSELAIDKVQSRFVTGVSASPAALTFSINSKTAHINIASEGLLTHCSNDLPGAASC